jgi:hypothetical protein
MARCSVCVCARARLRWVAVDLWPAVLAGERRESRGGGGGGVLDRLIGAWLCYRGVMGGGEANLGGERATRV